MAGVEGVEAPALPIGNAEGLPRDPFMITRIALEGAFLRRSNSGSDAYGEAFESLDF